MKFNQLTLLTTVLSFVSFPMYAQVQTWRGVDKLGLEQNTLILHPDGFYKFYEESVVLLEDSLELIPELGLYRQHGDNLELLPLTGATAYRSFNYVIEPQRDSVWQVLDYEKGNSGQYKLVTDSVGITTAEMDFFKGVPLQQKLLQTTWQTEAGEEQWQFIAPNFAILKKEGMHETVAQAVFTNNLLTFIELQDRQIIFRAEIGSLTDDLLSVRHLRDGRYLSLKKQNYQGLTARETGWYKNYLRARYGLEVGDLTTFLEWGKDKVKVNYVEE